MASDRKAVWNGVRVEGGGNPTGHCMPADGVNWVFVRPRDVTGARVNTPKGMGAGAVTVSPSLACSRAMAVSM